MALPKTVTTLVALLWFRSRTEPYHILHLTVVEAYYNEAETKWPPFSDDIFNWIVLNENVWISITISLKFVPRSLIDNFQHWFRHWLWHQATSHYLNQWWIVYWRVHGSLGLNELTHCSLRYFADTIVKYIFWTKIFEFRINLLCVCSWESN